LVIVTRAAFRLFPLHCGRQYLQNFLFFVCILATKGFGAVALFAFVLIEFEKPDYFRMGYSDIDAIV
jgi:hypothetical protein